MGRTLFPTLSDRWYLFSPASLNLRATEAQQEYILAQMSWKLHSIWISKPEKGEWGEQEEGGSSPGPIQPLPSFPTSCCREADCRVRTQGVMQRKEPCWTAAQARFKNKHFAVRIKANSAFMYITSYMFRRKRFFWLLEEREAEGRASKRGGPSFPTQKPLIRWSDPKVCASPLTCACAERICWAFVNIRFI